MVDPDDEWLLNELLWYQDANGYIRSNVPHNGYQIGVWLHHYIVGQPIDGSVVDHIDRDPSNNRRSNLRYATRSENALNSTRSDRARHIRVTYNNKYEVRITKDGQVIHVGTFATEQEAVAARDEVLHG